MTYKHAKIQTKNKNSCVRVQSVYKTVFRTMSQVARWNMAQSRRIVQMIQERNEARRATDPLQCYYRGNRSDRACCVAFESTLLALVRNAGPLRVVPNNSSTDTNTWNAPRIDNASVGSGHVSLPLQAFDNDADSGDSALALDVQHTNTANDPSSALTADAVEQLLEHIDQSSVVELRARGEDVPTPNKDDRAAFEKFAGRIHHATTRRPTRSVHMNPQNAVAVIEQLHNETGITRDMTDVRVTPDHLRRGMQHLAMTPTQVSGSTDATEDSVIVEECDDDDDATKHQTQALAQQLLEEQPSDQCRAEAEKIQQRFDPQTRAKQFRDSQQVGFAHQLNTNEDLAYVDGQLRVVVSDGTTTTTSTTAATTDQLHDVQEEILQGSTPMVEQAAYERRFETDAECDRRIRDAIETDEQQQEAYAEQVRSNAQQSQGAYTDLYNRMVNGVFGHDVRSGVARLLTCAPSPTVSDRSEFKNGDNVFQQVIPVRRALLEDVYMMDVDETNYELACSRGQECEGMRINHGHRNFILREANFLPLMLLMRCKEASLTTMDDVVHAWKSASRDSPLLKVQRQMCILCLLHCVQQMQCISMGENTTLPSNRLLCNFCVFVDQVGEFHLADCLSVSTSQYTGLVAPVPIHTLNGYEYHERVINGRIRHCLRFRARKPELDRTLNFPMGSQ